MVTELGTGLGMLGDDDLDDVLRARSPVMRSLSPDDWDRLGSVRAGGAYDTEFQAAWLNGRSFLAAREGLTGRGRRVERGVAGQRRRGGPRRSAHRPRLPGQLQIHVEDSLQRLAHPRVRLPAGRRAGPAR